MPKHNTVELIFGNPDGLQAIVAFLEDRGIDHKTSSIAVERYAAGTSPSTYEVLAITVPALATLLAPFLHDYLKAQSANWFASKESPTNHFVDDEQVVRFLAELSKHSSGTIKFETPTPLAKGVKVTLHGVNDNDEAVVSAAIEEAGGTVASYKQLEGIPAADVVITGMDVNAVCNHLLSHQHFWPQSNFT